MLWESYHYLLSPRITGKLPCSHSKHLSTDYLPIPTRGALNKVHETSSDHLACQSRSILSDNFMKNYLSNLLKILYKHHFLKWLKKVYPNLLNQKKNLQGWRDGSVIKSTCSCRELSLNFQHTWWLTIIWNSSLRESDTLFWPLWEPRKHPVHKCKCRQNTHIYKIKISLNFFKRNLLLSLS